MRVISLMMKLFTIAGILSLAVALYLAKNTYDLISTASVAEGQVTALITVHGSDNGVTYKPVVQFTTKKGETIEHISSTSSYPPAYDEGESVEILYAENNPQHAKINDFFSLWGASAILGVLGAVFSLAGLGFFIYCALKRRQANRLRRTGTLILSTFKQIVQLNSVVVNNRHPWQILTTWQDPLSKKTHTFKSQHLWDNPSELLSEQQEISVWIEPGYPDKYWMDTEFLSKK